ncbi:MAG TPA: peptidylprolyl isomerase [Paenalcaligenes sp.]|nr:peptidylprolyl isomerase [Paenalcaligenes sp.]
MKVIPIQPDNRTGQNVSNPAQNSGDQTYLDPQMYMDPPPKSDKPIVVNGEKIDLQDIALEAQNHPMPQHKPGWAWHAAAQALVWRRLFLQEAKRRQIQAEPVELQPGRLETSEEALIRQLFEEATPEVHIDEADLRAHYEQNTDRYRGPSLYEAAHILFMADPKDPNACAQAKQKAQAVYEELLHQPKRFAHMAKEHSDCPSASDGGLMGQISTGDVVPEFEASLRTLEVGEIGKPVQSRYGYHIIRLDHRAIGQPLPFETVLPQLREAKEKAHWIRASKAFMNDLLERSEVIGIDMGLSPWYE